MARFFDLPAELRNEIYRLALQGTTLIVPDDGYRHPSFNAGYNKTNLGLLHSNRQLRSEVNLLFYAAVHFIFKSEDALVAWLKDVDPKALAALEHVTARIYHKSPSMSKSARARSTILLHGWRVGKPWWEYNAGLVAAGFNSTGQIPKLNLELWSTVDNEKVLPIL